MKNNIFSPADILIPEGIDVNKWSVVACDQYTSEPQYWEKVSKHVGDAKSTLNIMYPEIYLNEPDFEDRIKNINKNMDTYLEECFLKENTNSIIYVERTLANGSVRRGLMGKVDLECYDYMKGSTSLIRATEGTVLERIPPRVKIRENASLEMPHIMLLVDDPDKKIIEPLADKKCNFKVVYDTELMMNSGSIKGYAIDDDAKENIDNILLSMLNKDNFNKKYSVADKEILLFAVGDGNHSLATAKACYENYKKEVGEEKAKNSAKRYALIELVNLHDESLQFEPIHRVVFDIDTNDFIKELSSAYTIEKSDSIDNPYSFEIITKDTRECFTIKNPDMNLTVGCIQKFIDAYLEGKKGYVDYIHGANVVNDLSKEENNLGIILKGMDKSDLFKTVILDGALPRKTFSMGEAEDKRFYLETRKIAE